MQKTLRFLAALSAVLLLREKEKKLSVFPTFFSIRYILKTKRRPAKKNNKETCSCQFEARIPKIRRI